MSKVFEFAWDNALAFLSIVGFPVVWAFNMHGRVTQLESDKSANQQLDDARDARLERIENKVDHILERLSNPH